MTLEDFRGLVARLVREIPDEFYDGIIEVTVSSRTSPHPTRGDIWTLGECIPVSGDAPGEVQSRIVLYHGSFATLASITDAFDWVGEARETLQHELRHHIEWRARRAELEAYDRAAEENFARLDGEPFDPLFFLEGEQVAPAIYKVDDDWFLDRVVSTMPETTDVEWHGRRYEVTLPEASLPAFVTLEELRDPPPGDVTLVFRRKPGLLALFRRDRPTSVSAVARPAGEGPSQPGGRR